jgi:hypothetical protein
LFHRKGAMIIFLYHLRCILCAFAVNIRIGQSKAG